MSLGGKWHLAMSGTLQQTCSGVITASCPTKRHNYFKASTGGKDS